uniref:Uncharacterized protein n=1 Tax=Heliothis virescens TaxID=7102 RepID=A0A2A4K847_HELVI
MQVLYHISIISLYTFALWYDQKYVHIPYPAKEFENVPFNARAIFFTFWTVVLQNVYFIVALLNDIFGTNTATKKPPLIRQFKDILFSITLSAALYVVLVFWIFYIVDKRAIFPSEEIEKIFPMWLNLIMHTLILPIILVELYITKRNYPSRKTGFSVAIFLTAIYAAYIHIVYFKYGIWPYPFLYVVSWTTKGMYFIGSAVLGMAFYSFGEKLDAMVADKNTRVTHTNGSKKIH